MKRFNEKYKEQQSKVNELHEDQVISEFREVYNELLQHYDVVTIHDLNEETQVAFLSELHKYWTETEGISEKGKNFLKKHSLMLTESSTPLQKKNYLKTKSSILINEIFRQSDIKFKLYDIIDEMYKQIQGSKLDDILSTDMMVELISEAFNDNIKYLANNIDKELSESLKELNEKEFKEKQRKSMAAKGTALPDGSFPISNKGDLKNAISSLGRAKDKNKGILPDKWNVNESTTKAKYIIKRKERTLYEDLSESERSEILEAIEDMGLTPGQMSPAEVELFLDAALPTKFTGNPDAYNYVHAIA